MSILLQAPVTAFDHYLAAESPKAFAPSFRAFYRFLREEVQFGWTGSRDHTYHHCARVLLFTLMIGQLEGLAEDQVHDAALAAVFHDSRRLDDGFDVGHGLRAAHYYRQYTNAHRRPFSRPVYTAIAFHERDDALALKAFQHTPEAENQRTVWRLLKDADALDRLRFGEAALDQTYLRTQAALQLLPEARRIVQESAALVGQLPD